MAHQCVKYRLTQEGTVPDFLYLGEDGVGGRYPVGDPSTPSPRDTVMVGITKDGATGDFEVFASKSDLLSYLSTIGANWVEPGDSPGETVPFDPAAATDWVWDRLNVLNA